MHILSNHHFHFQHTNNCTSVNIYMMVIFFSKKTHIYIYIYPARGELVKSQYISLRTKENGNVYKMSLRYLWRLGFYNMHLDINTSLASLKDCFGHMDDADFLPPQIMFCIIVWSLRSVSMLLRYLSNVRAIQNFRTSIGRLRYLRDFTKGLIMKPHQVPNRLKPVFLHIILQIFELF